MNMHEIINWMVRIVAHIVAILFAFFFFRIFIFPPRGKQSCYPDNPNIKRISVNRVLGKALGLVREDYYFDNEYLYEEQGEQINKISLAVIVRAQPTSTKINNRWVWAITYRHYGAEKRVFFLPNYSYFNRNFIDFLSAVRTASPLADIHEPGMFSR